MKHFLSLLTALLCVGMAVSTVPAQITTPSCSTATLNGKYAVSGQGDTYYGALCTILGLCLDQTTSTTGYLWFDGSGNIVGPTSGPGAGQAGGRLFEATNAGVSSTRYIGYYTIGSDCMSGTIQLISEDGKEILNYNVDPGEMDKTTGIAHEAAALDADPGRDEALMLNRTIDPAQGCGTNGTFTLAGISTFGIARGTDPLGRKISSIVETTYPDSSTFQGTEKISTNNVFSSDSFTGTYVIDSDCTVALTKTVNGSRIQGAHVITGTDSASIGHHTLVWQGDISGKGGISIGNGNRAF